MENDELLQAIEKLITSRIDGLRDELIERIDDSQTAMLRAFYDWGRPLENRIRSFEERMGAAESRLMTLEIKNLPPRAQ